VSLKIFLIEAVQGNSTRLGAGNACLFSNPAKFGDKCGIFVKIWVGGDGGQNNP